MHFFDVTVTEKKLYRYYERGDIFRSYIEKVDIFPLHIPLKKITQKDIQNSFTSILQDIKTLKATNLPLLYKEFHFKSIGKQSLPISVEVENEEAFLKLITKQHEFNDFVNMYIKIISHYPSLKSIILKKPFIVLEYLEIWEKFFKIIDFFLKNTKPNIYLREISLPDIDTKFIEKYKKILDLFLSNIQKVESLNSIGDFAFEKKYQLKYPLPQIRFRILDEALTIEGLKDISISIDAFEKLQIACKKVFIIENKITFLSFFEHKESIVIFGQGYGISALKNSTWLKEKEVYYWGDIDTDGFAILSQIRGYFPQIHSILMDSKTIEQFKNRAVKHSNNKQVLLKNLTDKEHTIYERLKYDFYGENFRLEQERIPFDFVKKRLSCQE